LRVAVCDSGPGISEEGQTKLFQPFEQVGDTAQRFGGTGLGLAISKRLVELLGGKMSLTSQLGHGSVFSFQLPVELAQYLPQGEPDTAPISIPMAGARGPLKALIVDDQDLNRRLLVELLRPFNFLVREAANGEEAVTQFERLQPSLVLMDLRMPVLDGYEAMLRIRARASALGVSVNIIAVTASAFDADIQKIRGSGADDVLRKPFRRDDLFRVVEGQLARMLASNEESACCKNDVS
jgi:CheY-like chemotaxis protein